MINVGLESNVDDVEIVNDNIVAGYDNSHDVCIEDLDDLDITVAKKEYVITGDDIYIPQLYDDAPQWMKDLVELVVDVSMTTNSTKLINDMNAMLQEFAVSYVPLNQYTQSILDLGNEDMRLNALLETLNSNFNNGLSNANAQIISLQMTKASKDEVVAQVIQTLSAQLADPRSNLGATVVRLDQAIVAEQTARATSFRALTASMESTNGEIAAKAEVLENALAYVGINEAGASTNTGLSAYLQASNGTIGGADSKVANDIRVTAEGVESKWAYNSTVNVNGVYRKSGFGLTANNFSGGGTKTNPYTSEFWIDATKLRFTNSNMTGRTAPFTIDASGATPQIKFNGVVEFNNVANVPQLGSTPQEVVNAINNGNTTTISGGKITTRSITANQIAASTITANEIATKGITADRIGSTTGNSTVWYGGGLVSANFNGNVHGNIGSPTSGFRLSSNAAGTSADPNIYGAYIKASTMEFLYAGIPGTNNSGRFNYSATASGGAAVMLVSPNYGTGYADNRITSLQNSILTIIVTIPYGLYNGGGGYASAVGYMQRSINGASYTNISSQSASIEQGTGIRSNTTGNFVITYMENLANLGNFDTLYYRASNGGTVMVTLNN